MTPDKATALREAAETVFSQIRLIDACGQVCVDSDSIERGVRKALEPLLAERERLRGALEGLFNASASLFNEAASLTSETPRDEALDCTKGALAEMLPEFERARQALEATHD